MGVCNCSMFCYTLRYVHSSIAIILMKKRELVALLNLSSWCLLMVVSMCFVRLSYEKYTFKYFIYAAQQRDRSMISC